MSATMILLIDNYDSFVHNLARYFVELGQEVRVVRNDDVGVADVRALAPGAVVLSPGPCDPARAGICVELVREMSGEVPILGVCLGHQAIAMAFGGRVLPSGAPRHGVASAVTHDGHGVFENLPNPLQAARYHSLVVERASLPTELKVTAVSHDGDGVQGPSETIMAIRHFKHPTVGVQFHPESVLTPCGHQFIGNFLRWAGMDCTSDAATGASGEAARREIVSGDADDHGRGQHRVREVS
jgi:anthranilate synthase/aminodeoxychorismate synthase-like glutamine amidotransferase